MKACLRQLSFKTIFEFHFFNLLFNIIDINNEEESTNDNNTEEIFDPTAINVRLMLKSLKCN